jgi:hypothetical protein
MRSISQPAALETSNNPTSRTSSVVLRDLSSNDRNGRRENNMVRFFRFVTNLVACAALLLTTGIAVASGGGGTTTGGGSPTGGGGSPTGGGGGTVVVPFAGLSLSVSNEAAPAGGIAQMKVTLTEPQPITTGKGRLTLTGFTSVSGIAVMGPTPDVAGIALVQGTSVDISVLSPSGTYGSALEYPILTVAGRVDASASVGSKFPVSLEGLNFLGAFGTNYPLEIKAGSLTVSSGVAIGDVLPGSAIVPAGGIVTLIGSNFLPNTTIKCGTGRISQVRYISPTRIDLVMGTTVNMHGNQIKAQNPDKSQSTYYSYQRTYPMPASSDSVLRFAMPLFSPLSVNTATISLPAPDPDRVLTYGVGLQNVGSADAASTIELLDADGNPIAVSSLTVTPSNYVVRELSELFGFVPAGVSGVRVTSSSAPIEVIGVIADQLFGTATPILAH